MPYWTRPPADLRLDADELHFWLIPTGLSPVSLRELAVTLAPDEQERAERFRFERDRIRYVAARGSLRRILGRYLRIAPAALSFTYSNYGKPALAPTGEDAGLLSFNISHSGDWAACAVTLDRRVGVDIEQARPELADGTIAERFFSPREVAALRLLPHNEQAAAFFRCWTRKEAFVKARGEGLSLPLDRFDVSLLPGEPPALLRTLDDPAEAERWRVFALPVPPGYEAAVVVEARAQCQLQSFLETS
jgi:4'-phosphopantetheinyl transferase